MTTIRQHPVRFAVGLAATLGGFVISQVPSLLTDPMTELGDPQRIAVLGVLLFNVGVFVTLSVIPPAGESEDPIDVQELLDWFEDCDRREADRQARLNTFHYDEFRSRSK